MMPQAFGVPEPPHVCGGVQVPQSMRLPQPSPMGPQVAPRCWQVMGLQSGAPHMPGTPPPPQV
jgi:hypothetical protein